MENVFSTETVLISVFCTSVRVSDSAIEPAWPDLDLVTQAVKLTYQRHDESRSLPLPFLHEDRGARLNVQIRLSNRY
jgi:hypothetical protein